MMLASGFRHFSPAKGKYTSRRVLEDLDIMSATCGQRVVREGLSS